MSLAAAGHYLAVGRPERALELLDALVDVDVESLELRARALHDLERFDEAAVAARRALELDPASIGLLDLLALCELGRGDLAAAERAVLEALTAAPDDPVLLAHYALLLVRGVKLAEAAAVLAVAEEHDHAEPAVRATQVALGYVRGGAHAAAAPAAHALAQDPEDATAHRALGVHHLNRGSPRSARRHLDELVRADPTDGEAAELARHVRRESHPLLAPVWLRNRLRSWRGFGIWAVTLIVIANAGSLATNLLDVSENWAFVPFCVVLFAWPALNLYDLLVGTLVRSAVRPEGSRPRRSG